MNASKRSVYYLKKCHKFIDIDSEPITAVNPSLLAEITNLFYCTEGLRRKMNILHFLQYLGMDNSCS